MEWVKAATGKFASDACPGKKGETPRKSIELDFRTNIFVDEFFQWEVAHKPARDADSKLERRCQKSRKVCTVKHLLNVRLCVWRLCTSPRQLLARMLHDRRSALGVRVGS